MRSYWCFAALMVATSQAAELLTNIEQYGSYRPQQYGYERRPQPSRHSGPYDSYRQQSPTNYGPPPQYRNSQYNGSRSQSYGAYSRPQRPVTKPSQYHDNGQNRSNPYGPRPSGYGSSSYSQPRPRPSTNQYHSKPQYNRQQIQQPYGRPEPSYVGDYRGPSRPSYNRDPYEYGPEPAIRARKEYAPLPRYDGPIDYPVKTRVTDYSRPKVPQAFTNAGQKHNDAYKAGWAPPEGIFNNQPKFEHEAPEPEEEEWGVSQADIDIEDEHDAVEDKEADSAPYSQETLHQPVYDQSRNPYTGEYWGRPPRAERQERDKYVRPDVRQARPQRDRYVPKRSQGYVESSVEPQPEQQEYNVYGKTNPWEVIEKSYDVPDYQHRNGEGEAGAYPDFPEPDYNKTAKSEMFGSDEWQPGDDFQDFEPPKEESAPAEEGEDGEEETEEAPPLEKEDYMTRAYYMPGYISSKPQKEYPPHIRAFKNYIGTIGDFKKHGYEKEDYSPNTEFAPDTNGFGPDTSGYRPGSQGYGPDSSGFRPDVQNFNAAGGNNYRPKYDAFTPVNKYNGYKPQGQNYGGYKPKSIDYGEYRPTKANYRPAEDYRVDYQPESPRGNYRPNVAPYGQSSYTDGGWTPRNYGTY